MMNLESAAFTYLYKGERWTVIFEPSPAGWKVTAGCNFGDWTWKPNAKFSPNRSRAQRFIRSAAADRRKGTNAEN